MSGIWRAGKIPVYRFGRRILSGLLGAAAICWVTAGATAGAAQDREAADASRAEITVEWQDGLLTLRAVNAPLGEVIAEIGARAGFKTTFYGAVDSRLDRSFDEVPLDRVLRELLAGVSNIVLFDDAAQPRVTEILLFGAAGPDKVPAQLEADPEPATATVIDRSLDAEQAEQFSRSAERGRGGDAEAVAEVAALLRSDPDPAIRGAAAAALGDIGSAEAVVALQGGVRDENRTVRIRSIRALAGIDNDQSTQILADLLFNHADTRTRLLAAWALGQQGSPLAQSYLETARDDGNDLVRQAVDRARSEGAVIDKPGSALTN